MRKLTVPDPDTMRPGILDEIQRHEDARYDHRLHGILLICAGMNCCQVAELLGQAPRTVQYWVRRFERHGFAGLQEKQNQGRPSSLTPLWTRSEETYDNPHAGYSQNLWDGKLLSYHLSASYDVQMGVRQCQRLFKRLEFRLRKPRPVIAKGDPAEQEAY